MSSGEAVPTADAQGSRAGGLRCCERPRGAREVSEPQETRLPNAVAEPGTPSAHSCCRAQFSVVKQHLAVSVQRRKATQSPSQARSLRLHARKATFKPCRVSTKHTARSLSTNRCRGAANRRSGLARAQFGTRLRPAFPCLPCTLLCIATLRPRLSIAAVHNERVHALARSLGCARSLGPAGCLFAGRMDHDGYGKAPRSRYERPQGELLGRPVPCLPILTPVLCSCPHSLTSTWAPAACLVSSVD